MAEQDKPAENLTLLFYRQVAALHPERHADFKLGMAHNQEFASQTNSIPLAGVEFAETGKEYPIVFTRSPNGEYTPVAVLGLENGENLFLDEDKRWKSHYVPAFVRRYPFVLGENPDNPSQPWVCVDEACPWVGKVDGEPFFVAGQPSAFLKQTMAFLTDYNLQSQRTAAFCRKLNELGLMKENQAQATTPDGKSYTLTGFWVIDEAALLQLKEDVVQELFKSGELAWIYFHLASLGNMRLLAERKSGKTKVQGPLH